MLHEMPRLTLPVIVSVDWLTNASGTISSPVAASMALEPAPPVAVTDPRESVPSSPIGRATTEFSASFVMKYTACAPSVLASLDDLLGSWVGTLS